jgi:hypothetical protein
MGLLSVQKRLSHLHSAHAGSGRVRLGGSLFRESEAGRSGSTLGLAMMLIQPSLVCQAFVSPNVLALLQKEYGLKQVDLEDHDKDLKAMLDLVKR